MDQAIIRFSEQQDFPRLIDIDHLIWNDTNAPLPIHWESVEAYARVFPVGSQLVSVMDGNLCGYINLKTPIPIESNRHVTEMSIGIHPDYQGKGVGKALIEGMEAWAKEQGKKKISLRVFATNTQAIRFYEKHGYIEQGRLIKEFCLNGAFIDDILMYKWIG